MTAYDRKGVEVQKNVSPHILEIHVFYFIYKKFFWPSAETFLTF